MIYGKSTKYLNLVLKLYLCDLYGVFRANEEGYDGNHGKYDKWLGLNTARHCENGPNSFGSTCAM